MCGQEEDRRFRRDSPDLDGRAHSIHHRHIDIHDYDIGAQLADFFYGLFSIRSLAAYLERMLLQKRPERRAHKGGVVNEKYSGSHGSAAGGAGRVTARLPHYVHNFVCLSAQYGTCRITFREWR